MSCFTALLGLFLVATPATAQIPTTDAASVAQLMQQVQNGLQQIGQLQSQIGLQTDQLQAQQAQLQAQQSMVQGLGRDYTGGTATMLQQSAKVMQDLRNLESMGQEMKSLLDGGQNFPLSAILQRMQQLTQAQQAVYRNAKTWQDQMDANQQVYGSQVQQAVGASNTAAGPTGVGQATNQILATLSAQLTEQTRMLSAMQTQQMQQQQLDKAQEAVKLRAFNSGWPSNTGTATKWLGGSSEPTSTIPTY